MNSALINITQAEATGDFRVELRCGVDGAEWSETLAEAIIPANLDGTAVPPFLPDGPVAEQICAHVYANEQSPEFGAIGDYLAGLVFRGAIVAEWENLRADNPDGLRTMLRVEPSDLRLLPWELMRRDVQLFVDPVHPWVRITEMAENTTRRLVPIRALIVEAERDDELGTRAEIRAIKRALPEFRGQLEAEFLLQPSTKTLKDAYRELQPDIFHFIGHGEFRKGTREPVLSVLDGDAGKYWQIGRQYIMNVLLPTPRVAILNACRSGQVDQVRALTDAFLARGSEAVLGMQGDVRGQAAALFGGELYRALAREEPIDKAVAAGRAAVYAAGGDDRQERDWFLPSLTVRVRPEQVLSVSPGIPSDERSGVHTLLGGKIDVFVDRFDERNKVVKRVDPDPDRQPVRLVVVAGDLEAGKSHLLHWIRRRCALRGRRVRYVDFRGGEMLNVVRALCAIRDTPEDVRSLAGPAAGAFRRFNYDLNFLAAGRLPVEPTGALPEVPAPQPADLVPGPVDVVERTFQSFREALGLATAQTPLILILDHLDGLTQQAFRQGLYPHLVRRIVDGELPNVRLVVVLSNDQERHYWPPEEGRVGEWVDVPLIEPDQYECLAEDVVLALGRELRVEMENIIKAVKALMRNRWSPKELQTIKGFALKD